MGSSSFAADAIGNPSRYYRRPRQVVQDRRLSRQEKSAILEAWEVAARAQFGAEELAADNEQSLLAEVKQARAQLEDDAGPAPARAGSARAIHRQADHQLASSRLR